MKIIAKISDYSFLVEMSNAEISKVAADNTEIKIGRELTVDKKYSAYSAMDDLVRDARRVQDNANSIFSTAEKLVGIVEA